MKIVLKRTYLKEQTLGEATVLNGKKEVFKFKTLELAWRDNSRRISCIPEGSYLCQRYTSAKYPDVWQIMYVPNRDKILIHCGNYSKTDTLGCILVGKDHKAKKYRD